MAYLGCSIRVFLCAVAAVVVIAAPGAAIASSDGATPVIGGIRLAAPPPDVVSGCRHAAHVLAFRVACPTRLPAGWSTDVPICPTSQCKGQFSMTAYFPGPPGYVGDAPRSGHMNVWAIPVSRLTDAGLGCPGTRSAGRVSFAGHGAMWFACPNGGSELDSGHMLLQWVIRGIAYGVSAHGHSVTNRRLVLYVAEHLEAVRRQD